MVNTSIPQQKSRKKKIWLSVIAGIIVIAVGLWGWNQFTPRPLGDRLEYLGKEDYGNIFGFDYFPASTYYYGTDLPPNELAKYFPKANYAPHDNFAFEHANFITSDNTSFIFIYEKNPPFTTDRKFVISLSDSQYQRAKDSL